MTTFNKDEIVFDAKAESKVALPQSSKQKKLFLDSQDNKLKTIDYAGKIEDVGKQEINLVSAEAESTADGYEYTIRIPSPLKKLEELNNALNKVISSNKEELLDKVAEVSNALESFVKETRLANGVFDSDIASIVNKINEEITPAIEGKIDTKEFELRLSKLSADLITIVGNINASLDTKVAKRDFEGAIRDIKALIPNVVAGSSNVEIKKIGNSYEVYVDVPEVTKEVVREIQQIGGGVSKKWVQDYVEDALSGYTPGISGGGSAGIQGRLQLDDVNTTFTITHPAINENVEFPVASLEVADALSDLHIIGIHNRTSTSFQVTLSGLANTDTYLLWHISTQSTPGMTTIASSGGSIIVTQIGNDFNLEVASPSGGSSSGIQGRITCNNTDRIYTITHTSINPSIEYPVVSLDVPLSGSELFVQGIFDRTPTSFKVVLSSVPTNAYGILYHISTQSSLSGDLQQQIDGLDTSLVYDIDGKLSSKTTSRGTQTFNYNIDGQLVSISGSGQYVSKSFTYNIDGQLISIDVI